MCHEYDTIKSFTIWQPRSVVGPHVSNMAVNLTDLSLPQLEGLKSQLDQVLLYC